jgi:hypothetical protein
MKNLILYLHERMSSMDEMLKDGSSYEDLEPYQITIKEGCRKTLAWIKEYITPDEWYRLR